MYGAYKLRKISISKKALLSCTAAVAVMLFSTHFNTYAKILKVENGEEKTASGNSYDAIEATGGGKINGKDFKIVSSDAEKFLTGVTSKDSGSEIKLTGTTTIEKVKNGFYAEKDGKIVSENLTIKGIGIGIGVVVQDSDRKIELNGKTIIQNVDIGFYTSNDSKIVSGNLTIIGSESEKTTTGIKASNNSKVELNRKITIEKVVNGLDIQNGATIKMTDGSITASQIGALFNASKNDKNKRENVTISSGKDNAFMDKGLNADKSTVALNNVGVTQANTGILANDSSVITVTGGSFSGKTDWVYAKQDSTIALDEKTTLTSSDGHGLHADGPKSQIAKDRRSCKRKTNGIICRKR
ncbi:hypothetical protein HNQ69_000355 [Bartonella callosciuri]|uniref:Uncharacterized protein n=1 Tax=Bartonella callosciuri TaxID=686223 RepID=A0A840NQ92_9HYPH|nr:hypothetical protein [Bartonella callosciuri]MBB5073251.1 hypothetical protein [Bartonella callosciuri]